MILRLSENFINKYKYKNLYIYKPASLYIDHRAISTYAATDFKLTNNSSNSSYIIYGGTGACNSNFYITKY